MFYVALSLSKSGVFCSEFEGVNGFLAITFAKIGEFSSFLFGSCTLCDVDKDSALTIPCFCL